LVPAKYNFEKGVSSQMDNLAGYSSHKDASSAITLSITFSGPLLYDFAPADGSNSVIIYAPYCPYHLAAFFYSINSLSEADLWKCAQSRSHRDGMKRAYTITGSGIITNPYKPVVITPSYPMGFSSGFPKRGTQTLPSGYFAPRTDKMLFQLTLPCPGYVHALYYDKVEIVPKFDQPPNNNNIAPHFTGLRFFYAWDAKSPIQLQIPSGDTFDIEPPVFREFPTLADIEVRYEGLGLTDDDDPHSDARSCFASLATLAGLEWWLNYGDGKSSPTNPSSGATPLPVPGPCAGMNSGGGRLELHTGGDCHAAVIVNGLDI
jgi:hypothetical protein